MFEARLIEGRIFKQIIDSIRDLVSDLNIECNSDEISIQCMDSAHVALVSIELKVAAFEQYRCDRTISLGFNTTNMSKILKMMNNTDDTLILKAEDDGDILTMVFESDKNESISDFELKLMDIDSDQLTIPDTPYKCTIKMPSCEFQRIVRDLQALGDTCTISCSKDGIRFSTSGSIGTGNILIRANSNSEKEEDHVLIHMDEAVELNFALRYLNFFTKATPLSKQVIISMSPDIPIVVEYPISDVGHVNYFLAPKIEDHDDDNDNNDNDDNNPGAVSDDDQ